MPHQCLKCGKVFEEGSAQLLKGCPDCGGNRFFFTKQPLGENERQAITEKVGNDINSAIMEIMGKESPDSVDKAGDWVKIKPKDVRKAMEKHLGEKKTRITADEKEDIEILTDEDVRRATIEKIESEADQSETPETIDIEKPGKYKIDLKGLLEEEPIIIQKDGSYTIHLPSIFKMIDKEKE
jgi:predicted  nucleic acid-binding Zn-ribbon protein